jgi:hypothetical protein
VFISILCIFPIITKAESIINNNGVEISEEEYEDFLKVYSHEYIMTMTEEKYEDLKTLDFSNIETETKYIETTYNQHLNLTTEKELTEDEYNDYLESSSSSSTENSASTLVSNGSAAYSTQVKQISIALITGTTWHHVTVTATWKAIPSVRSYDVIGMRGQGFDFRNGSQEGYQIYIEDGTYKTISYAWNGTNIQRHDNGFGISMNIVNNTITDLQLIVEGDVKATEDYPAIYGSYQHAQKSLTLANSQNYTLGGSGLGSVFIFPYSISSKYDGMSGVRIQY